MISCFNTCWNLIKSLNRFLQFELNLILHTVNILFKYNKTEFVVKKKQDVIIM